MPHFFQRVLRRVLRRLWPAPAEELGVREAYARLADGYLAEAHNPFMRLEETTMLGLLPDVTGKAALDVGCGTGRYLRILRERGAALTVGLDLSPEMLGKARGLAPLARADLRALPIAAARFDLVTSGLAVGHVADLATALAEMARVLVPGGTLLYSDFHPSARLAGHARSFTVGGRAFNVEHHLHLPDAHRAACGAAGLEIEEMRDGVSATRPPFPAVLAIRARRRR
jgi:SAM-dependent methyltransferase